MKKLSIVCLMLGLAFTSCTTSKLATNSENALRGDWTLYKVESRNPAASITTLFNQASPQCFQGSEWHLVANNNSGNYVLNGMNCPTGQNNINWHVAEEDGIAYFWFKQIPEGQKAKNIKSGYKMRVESADANAAHLSHEVPFGTGKTVIDYYFVKK
ncbi:hypothetical protein KRX57_10770 [Weeksellaceae bacterium TAE3-ERU29]|nr:hypothetical protein [Weeksellaceae bacterium TAE3-ERU29]